MLLSVSDPPGADLDVGVKLSGTGEYETATIPAGSTSTTFEIAFVNDDVPESDETIVVSLDDSSPDYTAGPDNTLTIVNDDEGLMGPAINTPSSYGDGPDGPIYVSGPQSISITNPNSRGTIYYTTDNTDPMSSGTRTEYTDAFDIDVSISGSMADVGDSSYTVTTVPSTGGSVYATEDDDGDDPYVDPTAMDEFPNADFDTIVDLGFDGMGSGEAAKQLYLNLEGSNSHELRETDASGSTDEVLSGIDNEVRAFTSH